MRGDITLGSRLAADLRTTYSLAGTDLRVCVERAVYPYSAKRGHRLFSCFTAVSGKHEQRFCGDGEPFADFRGYRISVGLRKPRFTESCDVWLEIEPVPPPRAI